MARILHALSVGSWTWVFVVAWLDPGYLYGSLMLGYMVMAGTVVAVVLWRTV